MAIIPPGQVLDPSEPLPEEPLAQSEKPQTRGAAGGRFPGGPILRAFVNKSMSQLLPSEATVWLALYAWVRHPTGKARLYLKRIAGLTGLSRSTVKRSLRRLMTLGLLVKTRRGSTFTQASNVFRVRGIIRETAGEGYG
jgi:hypothetical protein